MVSLGFWDLWSLSNVFIGVSVRARICVYLSIFVFGFVCCQRQQYYVSRMDLHAKVMCCLHFVVTCYVSPLTFIHFFFPAFILLRLYHHSSASLSSQWGEWLEMFIIFMQSLCLITQYYFEIELESIVAGVVCYRRCLLCSRYVWLLNIISRLNWNLDKHQGIKYAKRWIVTYVKAVIGWHEIVWIEKNSSNAQIKVTLRRDNNAFSYMSGDKKVIMRQQ